MGHEACESKYNIPQEEAQEDHLWGRVVLENKEAGQAVVRDHRWKEVQEDHLAVEEVQEDLLRLEVKVSEEDHPWKEEVVHHSMVQTS